MTNSAMTKSLSLDNATIADALERYAALLDASGSSYYAVRAYRRPRSPEVLRTSGGEDRQARFARVPNLPRSKGAAF
jgi:hypothetical protein